MQIGKFWNEKAVRNLYKLCRILWTRKHLSQKKHQWWHSFKLWFSLAKGWYDSMEEYLNRSFRLNMIMILACVYVEIYCSTVKILLIIQQSDCSKRQEGKQRWLRQMLLWSIEDNIHFPSKHSTIQGMTEYLWCSGNKLLV